MKRLVFPVLASGFAICLIASQARADLVLSIAPTTQNVEVGDLFDAQVAISGLGSGSPDSLGAFDFDLLFESPVLPGHNHFIKYNYCGRDLDIKSHYGHWLLSESPSGRY